MEEAIEIRPLKRKELGDLYLIAKVYYPTEPWLSEQYLAGLEARAVTAYSLRWSGRLIGGIIITADKRPNHWIDFMVVDRNMVKRGMGERLFLMAERDLESGSMLWHATHDTKTFAPSKKFLIKMGMEQRGSLKGWFGRTDAVVYAKRIR
ncbi:MAG: GNAT family N-acetyltransferase [bacterium]|nr:GNAT family N-acetyltransferase [bacterium]